MKILQPAPSYEVTVPDDVVEDHDGRVSSYWPGSALLLQLSSTLRIQGEQVSAADRLRDLHNRSLAKWSPFNLIPVSLPGDFVASQMVDRKGLRWIHAYLTTSDLAVYATISGLRISRMNRTGRPKRLEHCGCANLSSTSLSPSYLTSPELQFVHTLHESTAPFSQMMV